MKDTNQLPTSEREAFEAFAQNCPMGKYSIGRRGDGYDSSHTQLMWDAWQACAQVQGEPFGYIHHFAAHDESGVLIDTTWEADGCADPLPHPTFPSMWKWAQSTPFYTAPQATPVCGAQNAESDPQAPLSLTAAPQQATPDDMKVYASIADRYFREATQAQMTDERAAFEEWATNEGKWLKAVDRDHNGCYLLLQTSYAWTVWQARAILALRPEPVPMTPEQRHEIICRYDEGKTYSDLVGIILATEAKHGITAQAEKGGA